MTTLDPALVARAAPPGSMRQLAILFSPAAKRPVLEALYVIEREVFESARNASHDVAHTRLAWWRAEIDRLAHGTAQHPATRVLLPMRDLRQFDAGELHEVLVAADMDLARITFESCAELNAYARRAGGVVQAIGARWLAAPADPAPTVLEGAMRLGSIVRQVEAMRDLRRDACDGRVYLALGDLERAALDVDDLADATMSDALRAMLADWHRRLDAELTDVTAGIDRGNRPWLRHAIVLAGLHRRLMARMRRCGYDVASARIELGPVERVVTAWRCARTAT